MRRWSRGNGILLRVLPGASGRSGFGVRQPAATPVRPIACGKKNPALASCFGEFDEAEFRQAEVLVVSPGVSLADPSIQAARDAGVEIIGDIELFCRAARRPVIGVTGSNGKEYSNKTG